MTFVDAGDLASRTCGICGAVYGDAIRHRRWHREEDERTDATVDVLRALTSDLDRRARAEAAET